MDTAPVYVPANQEVLFLGRGGAGLSDLYRLNPLTGEVRVLAADVGPGARDLAPSTDGERVTVTVDSGDLGRSVIRTFEMGTGSMLWEIDNASGGTWSRNDDRFAYLAPDPQTARHRIWLRDLDANRIEVTLELSLDPVSVMWAPGGEGLHVVFFSAADQTHDLYALDLTTRVAQPLTLGLDIVGPLALSPTGDDLAFLVRDGALASAYLLSLTDGSVVGGLALTGEPEDRLTWSADGARLALAVGPGATPTGPGLITLDPDTGDVERVIGSKPVLAALDLP